MSRFVLFFLICLLFFSCSLRTRTDSDKVKTFVHFRLFVEEMKGCIRQPACLKKVNEDKITSLWVLQFIDGELQLKKYISNIKSEFLNIELIEGKSNLYFLANVSKDLCAFYEEGVTTESYLKSDTLSYSFANSILHSTDSGERYIPMLGELQDVEISSFDQLKSYFVRMDRSLARLDFVDSAGFSQLLKGLSGHFFISNVPKGISFKKKYYKQSISVINLDFSLSDISKKLGTLTFYLPVNLDSVSEENEKKADTNSFEKICVRFVGIDKQGIYEITLREGQLADFRLKKNQCSSIDLQKLLSSNKEVQRYDLTVLDKQETANCYIVNKKNEFYTFNARVMGNGKGTPALSLLGQEAPALVPILLDPIDAFVAWETGDRGDVIKELFLTPNGRVIFRVADNLKAGNALIAVKNRKGEVLWSWHIWKADYNPDKDYDVYKNYNSIYQFKMMKYNLGSMSFLVDEASIDKTPPGYLGLYYQWGRKDPFVGGIKWEYITDRIHTTTANGYEWKDGSNGTLGVSSACIGENSEASIDYAIKHPLHFISSFELTSTHDWINALKYADQRDNLWGNPNVTDRLINPMGGGKSIYDPCPPGWRVPRAESFQNFTLTGETDELKNCIGGFKKGYMFSTVKKVDGAAYWPALGCRRNSHGGVLTYIGKWGGYQSSSTRERGEPYANILSFNDLFVFPYFGINRADGFPVRCAKY